MLPIFQVLQQLGNLADQEAYRTFNMGIGLIMIVAPDQVERIKEALQIFSSYPIYNIGQVVPGEQTVRLS